MARVRYEKSDYDYFNVGTGEAVTIKKVAEALIGLYGEDIKTEIVNRYRVGDIRHCYADIEKIRKIGFKAKIGLEEGLKNLVEWGRQEVAVDKTGDANQELERRNLKL